MLVPALCVGAVATSAYLWYSRPGVFVRYLMRFALYQSGLRVKYVNAGKYNYCYAERGKYQEDQSSILFVHGFSASKDMWVPIVKRLPKDQHIVVVDMPGHGDTTIPETSDPVDILSITQYLQDFVGAVGMDTSPFHIVGTSMGGAVSALYAATRPDHVSRVTLVCPAMKTPIQTEFMKEVESGECRRLIPDDVEGMQHMMNSCMYKKPKLNRQILLGFLQLRVHKNEFYQRLFLALSEDDKQNEELMCQLSNIKAPVQLVWGRHDELIHISGIDVAKEKISTIERIDVFEECGHTVNMDRPGSLVKSLLVFRGDLEEREGDSKEDDEMSSTERNVDTGAVMAGL